MLRSLAAAALIAATAAAGAAPLDSKIDQMIAQGPAKRAMWGVYAVDVASGSVLADVNGTRLLVPASNRKLVSTALASTAFKPDDRIVTEFRAEAIGADGSVRGDAVLVAAGDPSWSPEFLGGRPGQAKLTELAKEAAKNGVRRIEGDLVIDTSRWAPAEPIPPGWSWDELQESYAPRPAALSLNLNLGGIKIQPGKPGQPVEYSFTTTVEPFEVINNSRTIGGGSAPTLSVQAGLDGRTVWLQGGLPADARPGTRAIPLGAPVEIWSQLFKERLEAEGIAVAGRVRIAEEGAPKGAVLLADAEGAPIAEIMGVCNRESDNFLAESLYLLAGQKLFGKASYRAAREAEARFWKKIGVGEDEVNAADGSGLSREDAITPRALVSLLVAQRKVDWFVDSLPVSGKSGTLKYRLGADGMAGRVVAKTGTLDGGSALSGYVKTNSGKWVAFSIMANNYTGATPSIRKKIDDIVVLLAQR